jgi:hypothetical protein
MSDQLFASIEKVRTAREVVRNLGQRVRGKEAEHLRAHSALSLAESELREQGLRRGIRVTVLDPEPERGVEQVLARTLRGYKNSEE